MGCLGDLCFVCVDGWIWMRWEGARTQTRSVDPSYPWTPHTYVCCACNPPPPKNKPQVKALLAKEKLPFVGVINNAGLLQVKTERTCSCVLCAV